MVCPAMSTIRDLIEAAISIAGSEAKLGKAAGFTQNAIWHAKRKGQVSAELAVGIERATDNRIPRWKLRPDLWDEPQSATTEAA